MTIDSKLLERDNPSRRSIDRLRGRTRIKPWSDFEAPEKSTVDVDKDILPASFASELIPLTPPTDQKQATKKAVDNWTQNDGSTGDKQPINRGQTADQPGTTGDNRGQNSRSTGDKQPINRGQTADQPGTNRDNRGQNSRSTGDKQLINRGQTGTTGDKQLINRGQNEVVPGLNPLCPRLIDTLSPVDESINRGQNEVVPGLNPLCPRLIDTLSPVDEFPNRGQNHKQPGTKSALNRGQNHKQPGTKESFKEATSQHLPSSAQQLSMLLFLAASQIEAGLEHTARIKRKTLAEELQIPVSSVKTQIDRLCRAGYLCRVEARDGRGDAGTIFRIATHVLKAVRSGLQQQQNTSTGDKNEINRGQNAQSTGDKNEINRGQNAQSTGDKNEINRGQNAQSTGDKNRGQVDVSSSYITTTNNTGSASRLEAEQLQIMVNRLALEEFNIGANNLLDAFRHSSETMEDFTASLEHIAFYLRSSDAEGIKHPKAWAINKLKAGYYPPPTGFVSWDEHQLAAKVAAAEQKSCRIKELRRREFAAGFEVWLAELPTDKRRDLLADTLFDGTSLGPGAIACLRSAYAAEYGQTDIESHDDA